MNFISLNPEENENSIIERNILSGFQQNQGEKKEIQQGMSPKAIAEIISDHLIEVVKKEFQKEVNK